MVIGKDGVINIQNLYLQLGPDYTLDELKSNPHFVDFKFNGRNDGYERYGLGEVVIDDLPFYINLYFYKNKISQIGLRYATHKPMLEENVEEYKGIVDLAKKKLDELMLKQHGATLIKYQWGSVGSFLDTRFQYSADLNIKYNWSDLTDLTFVRSMPPGMRQNLIIDENGHIYLLNTKLDITPQLTIHDVKNDPQSPSFKYFGWWNEYCDLGNVMVDRAPFKITLSFNFRTKLISKVWMTYSGFIGNRTVDLTPQVINSTKHFHDEWILGLKGETINKNELPQGKPIVEVMYPWGSVSSTSGRKGIPEILVLYNNN
jgi:hypothetical protein